MKSQIFIYSSGERLGPFSLDEIIEYTEAGRFRLDSLAYCSKVANSWKTLEETLLDLGVSIEWEDEEDEGKEVEDEEDGLGPEDESIDYGSAEEISENTDRPEEVQCLDSMLAHSREFKELSDALSVFNLWKVLNIRNLEVYHEKALKWMFDQKGTHGVGSSFLRNWLIEVLEYNQNAKDGVPTNALGPINLDYAIFKSVVERQRSIQVDGERKRLDLLFVIETMKQGKWAIMVEIKVGNGVSHNQLSSYRNWMEAEFPNHQRLLILLYDDLKKENEPKNWPEQEEKRFWIPATFSKLKNSIQETLSCYQTRIPAREISFIEQYLENLPPLASDINMEKAESLTHAIFGRFNSGIQFAIAAQNTSSHNRNYWQKQVVRFMANYPNEFRWLAECTEWKFLERELTERLRKTEWFPNINDSHDLLYDGLDCCVLFQDHDGCPNPEEDHLIVRLQLFYGSKGNLPCFRLRIRVENTPGFSTQRQNIIQDFFEQLHPFPPNYGGNDSVKRETGLIYNLPLEYPSCLDLFEQVDNILHSFEEVWISENFSVARNAILRHIVE